MTTRRIARIITGFILLLVAAVIGGSFYMLAFSLRPDARMREKNATAYEYMYAEYPFLRPWVDSLQTAGALRDTVIADPQGVRLHALYAAAPVPTDRTAVIVHGYTDCAVRMLMIGYLYNHDLGYNILLPDLYYHGQSEGRAIRMGWLDRFDLLRWMEIADGIFGGDTRMVVHGISMGAATTMMASGEPQRPYVRCFVEDCGYTGVWDEFSKELKSSFGLPAFPLLYTASWLCDLKYGWNFREASSLAQVAKCRLPITCRRHTDFQRIHKVFICCVGFIIALCKQFFLCFETLSLVDRVIQLGVSICHLPTIHEELETLYIFRIFRFFLCKR